MPDMGSQSPIALWFSHIDADRPVAFRRKTRVCRLEVFWADRQGRLHACVQRSLLVDPGRWPGPRLYRLDWLDSFLREPHLKSLLSCLETQRMSVQDTGPLHVGQ